MEKPSIFLCLACQCFFMTACEREEPTPSKELNFVVQRESIIDFHRFLEAIKLLIPQRGDSLDVAIETSDKRLSFISSYDSPGDPVVLYVSRDQVTMGAGAGQPLTIDELRQNLELLAQAASSASCKGVVVLISDKNVSGEYGLTILNVIADSGIHYVMLTESDLYATPVPSTSKKPSSPSARLQETKPATQSRQAKD